MNVIKHSARFTTIHAICEFCTETSPPLEQSSESLSYLRVQQLDPLTDVHQLLLSKLAGPVSLLHQGSQLLQLGLHEVVASLNNGNVLLQITIGMKRIVELKLSILKEKQKYSV